MRPCLAALLALCASCGPEPPAPEVKKPAPPRQAAEFPSGVFAITAARVVSDHCENRLRFSTKLLDIDLGGASVHSDPDNRLYEVVLDGATLVARGAFNRNSLCRTFKHLEIWRLERESDDEISGYRTTYWREPSRTGRADCLEACKVVYAVEAVRTDPESED